MKYMLDTNICIYVIKNKPVSVFQNFRKHQSEGLCISAVTLAELAHGVEKSENQAQNANALLHLLDLLKAIPFDAQAACE